MNVYALNFSPSFIERDAVITFLNTRKEVRNWLTLNESLVLIVCTVSLADFCNIFHDAFPKLYFTAFDSSVSNVNGWNTKNVWDFISEPTDSGYWSEKEKA